MPFPLFVNGTLMRGLELHQNLAGCQFLGEARTAPSYRLYSIEDRHPGMLRVEEEGTSIEGELYLVPEEVWQRIEPAEPPGLYRGMVILADGQEVFGILYHRELVQEHHTDISSYGGWRAYLATRSDFVPYSAEEPGEDPALPAMDRTPAPPL